MEEKDSELWQRVHSGEIAWFCVVLLSLSTKCALRKKPEKDFAKLLAEIFSQAGGGELGQTVAA